MARKDRIDAAGAAALIAFSGLLAFNQVVIKVVNDGVSPLFSAGLRSVLAFPIIFVAAVVLSGRVRPLPGTWRAGLMLGSFFAAEFVLLFLALDWTSVSRVSVIFYSMPVWMALGAHMLLPGEAITRTKALGLGLAFAGVAWAILDRPPVLAGEASVAGDLAALGAAMCWAGIGLTVRASALSDESPYVQLLWQLGVSAIVLMALTPVGGPLIRDFAPIHAWGMAFQVLAVASGGFLFWLWLMTIYPASGVASFSFLAPVFGVLLGWALLDEAITPGIFGALTLVAAGLILINRMRN